MTDDIKRAFPISRSSGDPRKLKAYGLENLGCILPKPLDPRSENTPSKANVPLKDHYRRSVQIPHSRTYWDNSAKDYRYGLLNDIAQEGDSQDRLPTRPKTRPIPDMSSQFLVPKEEPRIHPADSHQESTEQVRREIDSENYDKSKAHGHSENGKINKYEDWPEDEDDWETEGWEGLYHPYGPYYDAILNVQEDVDHTGNTRTYQSHQHLDIDAQQAPCRSDAMYQEYLRLKEIYERFDDKENAFANTRMSVSVEATNVRQIFRKPTYAGRQQPLFEDNMTMTNKETVFSRDSFNPFLSAAISRDKSLSASSTASQQGRDNESQTPSFLEEPLRRSASFDSRQKSCRENVFLRKDMKGSSHSPDANSGLPESHSHQYEHGFDVTVSTAMSRFRDMSKTAAITTQPPLRPLGSSGSCRKPNSEDTLVTKDNAVSSQHSRGPIFVSKSGPQHKPSVSTNEPLRRPASLDSQESFPENVFINKITVIESQHSQDPIFVVGSSSPPLAVNIENDMSSASTPYSTDKAKMTNTLLRRSASFDRRHAQGQYRGVMETGAAKGSQNAYSTPSVESPPISLGEQGTLLTASDASSRDKVDSLETKVLTTRDLLRRAASIERRRRKAEKEASDKKKTVVGPQQSTDPIFASQPSSSAMSLKQEKRLPPISTGPTTDPHGFPEMSSSFPSTSPHANHIELNSPAVVSELSFTPGTNIRPITPSPAASAQHLTSEKHEKNFEISPKRDVQCEKGKKHEFYEANPFIPAYSDSVIIGRPNSPGTNKGFGFQEHASIAGLSPVTCSGSQYRNSIFPNTVSSNGEEDEWGEEPVNRVPLERSEETIRVEHLSRKGGHPKPFHHPQTCMPAAINKKFRSVVDRYQSLVKEAARPRTATKR